MFVIVHNNYVVFGPREWNKLRFEEILREDCEVEFSLPLRNDDRSVFIINDDTKIFPVVKLDDPEYNGKTQRLQGPYWNYKDDVAEMYYVVTELPLDAAKNLLKGSVAANRYKAEVSGIKYNLNGQEITIDTTRENRDKYLQTHLTLDAGEVISWKSSEGWFDLSKEDLAGIISVYKTHIQNCFAWEKTKNEEIDAVTSLEELDAIDLKVNV